MNVTRILFDLVVIAALGIYLALMDHHPGMPDGLVYHGGLLTLGERKGHPNV